MRKIGKVLYAVLVLLCALILGAIAYWNTVLPNEFAVRQGERLRVAGVVTEAGEESTAAVVSGDTRTVGEEDERTLMWCGIIPLKTVKTIVSAAREVQLGGYPFGVKLYTDGVLIVSLSDVDAADGRYSPARKAGLRVGDAVISIDGALVYSNEEVSERIRLSGGKMMTFRIRRNGVESSVAFRAVKSVSENRYKVGMWVRDSSAGIGTVTFYDAQTHILAGLGHAVYDIDTGDVLPLADGEAVPARIFGVTRGESGSPGELRGGFSAGSFGRLLRNNGNGIYVRVPQGQYMGGNTLPVALKQEVRTGDAEVVTTVQGMQPRRYSIRITTIKYNDIGGTRNLVIRVTDPELLKTTGGIVQGMSGSPLIQNGKLIGAVTHVLVDDPTTGYAIFAENMLETAQTLANKGEIKDAS